jgi:2-amino-4-hydroxy-6-hydroxymethyldihydropteridine diphosphokinase
MAISALYESDSWGFVSEPFINQVIIIETTLTPEEVLARTQKIEIQLGRTRNKDGYEARTIDIDLLYYDDLVVCSKTLILPHPRISERRFVLVPLNEVAPNKTDPITGRKVNEMLHACSDISAVRLYTLKNG